MGAGSARAIRPEHGEVLHVVRVAHRARRERLRTPAAARASARCGDAEGERGGLSRVVFLAFSDYHVTMKVFLDMTVGYPITQIRYEVRG
jgi:hypothetical protein